MIEDAMDAVNEALIECEDIKKRIYAGVKWEKRRWDLVSDLTKAVFGKEKFNLEKYQTSWELDADCIVSQVDAIIERYRRG